MEERRIDPRLLCAELVEVIWTDEAGRQCRRVANLEDISLCGACVQVESPVPNGTSVSMHYGDGQLRGTIRYCLYQGIGYFLGVEFDEGCRWSRKHFRPRHLLDPQLFTRTSARHRSSNAPPPKRVLQVREIQLNSAKTRSPK
jgi:hypothetical protein